MSGSLLKCWLSVWTDLLVGDIYSVTLSKMQIWVPVTVKLFLEQQVNRRTEREWSLRSPRNAHITRPPLRASFPTYILGLQHVSGHARSCGTLTNLGRSPVVGPAGAGRPRSPPGFCGEKENSLSRTMLGTPATLHLGRGHKALVACSISVSRATSLPLA